MWLPRTRLFSYVLTRYADVADALLDPQLSANREQATIMRRLRIVDGLHPEFLAVGRANLMMMDPPEHTRLRRYANRAVAPRRLEALQPRIAAIIDGLLDRMRPESTVDWIDAFAAPLPILVISELLGFPSDDSSHIRHLSEQGTVLLDPLRGRGAIAQAQAAVLDSTAYLRGLFAARRQSPQGDFVTMLLNSAGQPGGLNDTEAMAVCMVLLAAGSETTSGLLGNAVSLLLQYPDQRRRLQDDRSLLPAAVEECLRFESPLQGTGRVLTADRQIDGRKVRKGQMVGIMFGSANRDPQQFDDPERLDIGRHPNPHLAFGSGVHACPGAMLARMQAEIALRALFERFPDFRAGDEPPQRTPSLALRGFSTLPLRLR